MSIKLTFLTDDTNGTPYTNFPELDPSTLFASAQEGLWWDCSNASTLYADTARTTPINGDDGDLVLGVLDRSGNDYHANSFPAYPSSNIRYSTDDYGYRCLQFDADNKDDVNFSGSEMAVIGSPTLTPFSGRSAQLSVWVVCETTSDASVSWRDNIFHSRDDGNSPWLTIRIYDENPYAIQFESRPNQSGDSGFGATDFFVKTQDYPTIIKPNTKVVLGMTVDLGQVDRVKAATYRINGKRNPSGVYTGLTLGATLNEVVYRKRELESLNLGIGGGGTNSARFKGKIYEVIWAHYRVTKAQETGIDKYLCRKHGIPFERYNSRDPSDIYFWQNLLLLGFNGLDGATSTVDESVDNRTVTFVGNAQLDDSIYQFGNSSLLLDGSGDYITVPDSIYFEDNDNMTAECWIRPSTIKDQAIFSKRTTQTGYMLRMNDSGNIEFFTWANNPTPAVNIVGSTTLSVDTWYHVAVTKSGSTWRIFLDGGLEAEGTQTAAYTTNSTALHIGYDNTTAERAFHGRIDEFRWTYKLARYTTAFDPITSPFYRY